MAKRFIQHEVLRNPTLRVEPTLHKLLWIALLTECDHAGIWIVDWPMMNLLLGTPVDPVAAAEFLGDKVIPVDNGRRWFIPSFIRFQYSNLATVNNAIKSVRKELDKYGINCDTLTLDQPLTNPSPTVAVTLDQGLQDKEEYKDKDIDTASLRARPSDPPPAVDRHEMPSLIKTEHRGKKVDWYEDGMRRAAMSTDKDLAKLKTQLGDARYAVRMEHYRALVEYMLNGDALACPNGMSGTVLMLKEQLTFIQYSNLADEAKSPDPIREIITDMHNSYAKSVKDKTSVYKTALNWLKRRSDSNVNGTNGHQAKVTSPMSTNKGYSA